MKFRFFVFRLRFLLLFGGQAIIGSSIGNHNKQLSARHLKYVYLADTKSRTLHVCRCRQIASLCVSDLLSCQQTHTHTERDSDTERGCSKLISTRLPQLVAANSNCNLNLNQNQSLDLNVILMLSPKVNLGQMTTEPEVGQLQLLCDINHTHTPHTAENFPMNESQRCIGVGALLTRRVLPAHQVPKDASSLLGANFNATTDRQLFVVCRRTMPTMLPPAPVPV